MANPARFGEGHDLEDDQKEFAQLELRDDLEFAHHLISSRTALIDIEACRRVAPHQTSPAVTLEFLVRMNALWQRRTGRAHLAGQQVELAALCDLERVGERLRRVDQPLEIAAGF